MPTVLASDWLSNNASSTVTIPSALNWPSKYGSQVSLKWQPAGKYKGDINYDPFTSAECLACLNNKIYIAATGNDTTGVGSIANPYLTPTKAITVGNATSAPYSIYMLAGDYKRTVGGATNNIYPTQDCAIVFYGGKVTAGAFDDYTWSQNTTTFPALIGNSNLWAIARTNLGRIYSVKYCDFGTGLPREYVAVGSVALCNSQPGTLYTDGTNVYLHPINAEAPTNTNTRVCLNVFTLGMPSIVTPFNFFMFGVTGGDYMESWGGIYAGYSTLPTVDKVFAVRDVVSMSANTTAHRNFATDAWRGLTYFKDCSSAYSTTDSFNFHNSLSSVGCYTLTINCSSLVSGVGSQVSCNGLTLHEDVVSIDVAGEYDLAQGGVVRNINTTKQLLAGTKIKRDRGDIAQGGAVVPTCVMADDSAQIWMDHVILEPTLSGQRYVSVAAAASVRYKNVDTSYYSVLNNGIFESY